jgi:hypothetical protein
MWLLDYFFLSSMPLSHTMLRWKQAHSKVLKVVSNVSCPSKGQSPEFPRRQPLVMSSEYMIMAFLFFYQSLTKLKLSNKSNL